jgi:predicted MFS family arabinose efflux permease
MRASLFGAALISLCLALLVITGAMALWHLIAFNLIGGTLTSFNHPTRQTIVPNLVKKEHLLNAVSLDNLSVQASRLIGMALAGYLIVSIGVGSIFVLRALGCFLSIAWLLIARVPPTPPATREQTPWSNLIEGFHYLRNNTTILGLMLLYLIPMLAQTTFTNFMPIFANDILCIGAVRYGYLQGATGLGAIIGLIALTMLTYYKGKAKLLSGAGIILGIGLIGFSASRWIFLSLPLIVITGGMIIVINSVNTTLIQNAISDQVRGRVMSWREVGRALGPTGSIFFGAIAQYTGVPVSLGLLGGLCLLASLLLIFYLPLLRNVE